MAAPDDGLIDLAAVPLDTSYTLPTGPAGSNPGQVSALMQQLSRKRLEAQVAVPTDDRRVQARLRDLHEPISLFGEDPADRRDRLRTILVDIEIERSGGGDTGDVTMADGATPSRITDHTDTDEPSATADEADGKTEEEFFTPGSEALLAARRAIARYSLKRAADRTAFQRVEAAIPAAHQLRHRESVKAHLAGFELFGSQLAGDRPACAARFGPGDKLFAVGNLGGGIKLFDVPSMAERAVLRGHVSRIGGLAWFPQPEGVEVVVPERGAGGASGSNRESTSTSISTSTTAATGAADEDVAMDASTVPQLASSDADGKVLLWNLSSPTPVAALAEHSARVCRVDVHPSGRYVGSASFDTTWRLWDVETTTELLLQEGHSREVYALSFHPDGSLVATGGLDSVGRVWDLRSGRSVMVLAGHVGPLYALDWNVDGVRVLSGSADGFVKCWDLRKVAECASTGGHVGGVTDIRWFRGLDGPGTSPERRPRARPRSRAGPGADASDRMDQDDDDEPREEDDDDDEDGRRDDGVSSPRPSHSPAPHPDRHPSPAPAPAHPPHTPKSAGSFFVSAGFDKNVNVVSADDWALCKPLRGHASHTLAVDVSADGRFVLSAGQDRTVKVWCRDDMAGVY